MKQVEFDGAVHQFPDDFTDADIAGALGGPKPDTRSTGTRLYQDYAAKPATNLLTKILEPTMRTITGPLVDAQRLLNGEDAGQVARTGSLFGERAGAATPVAQKLAEIAVPQTPVQAGMMAGTMGAGPAARAIGGSTATLAKNFPALARILGGTTGGAAGGAVADEGVVRGAGEGAVGSTLGEGLGLLMQRLRLAIPGGKRAANQADAERIGQTVGEIVPELAGARTTPDIRAMVEGQGRAALGQAKEGTTRAVEQSLPGVPAGINPGEIPTPGPLRGSLPDTGMPLRQANDALTSIGEGAFNQNILDRGAKKAADRRLYGEVARDMESGIATAGGPEAAGAFSSGQTAYSQGTKILDFFKRSGLVDRDGMMNVPKMQAMLNDPKRAAALRDALGEDGFQKLSDAIYRGAPRGEVDRMAPGVGNPLDALWSLLRRQNTGANMWLPILTGALGAPNLGSKYVGRNPLALPQNLRTILDVGAQRGVDEAMR